MTISPERLAAYADGELDAIDAQAAEAEIAASPDLQTQLAAHRALRARLTEHFAPIADQPVPQQLIELLSTDDAISGNVVDFASEGSRRHPSRPSTSWVRMAAFPAIAASLLAAIVGLNLWTSNGYADATLSAALDKQLVATQSAQAPVRVLLSFRDHEGDYCRGFAGENGSGIACRDERGWHLRKLFGGTKGTQSDYRQAGSIDAAVMSAIQDMAAGPALDAAAETAASDRGWRD